MGFIVDAVGGFLGSHEAEQAAKQNREVYQGARDTSMNALSGSRDATLAAWKPFYDTGVNGLQGASAMLQPGFQYSPSDPSYAWRLGEGMNALNRQQAASGVLQSGGAQKAAMRYGQGLASTEFGADFARRNQLAGYGVQGAQGMATAQDNYANGVFGTQFNAARGISGANTDKGEADAGQWGAIGGGLKSFGNFLKFPGF